MVKMITFYDWKFVNKKTWEFYFEDHRSDSGIDTWNNDPRWSDTIHELRQTPTINGITAGH